MLETLAVAVIVGLSGLWIIRYLWRELRGSSSDCGSPGCDCPLSRHCGPESTRKHASPLSNKPSRRSQPGVLLAVILGASALATAQEVAQTSLEQTSPGIIGPSSPAPATGLELRSESDSWWRQERLLSTELAERLAELGLSLESELTSEVFSCSHGGRHEKDATAVRGLLDVALSADLEPILGWHRSSLNLILQHASGNGITDRAIGDRQVISNIDAHDYTKLSELWFETSLSGRHRLKLGKLDGNSDLVAVDHGAEFINSSFGIIPTVPLPTFPYPALGLVLRSELASDLTLVAGIFDGSPELAGDGLGLSFGGHSVSALQLEKRRFLGASTLRIGAWYHSADAELLSVTKAGEHASSNHGAWLTMDVPVMEGADGTALGTFLQLGWAPSDRNELEAYLGGGLLLQAPFSSRQEDCAGLGVAHARLSEHLHEPTDRGAETTIELFYRAQILPWLAVQPDLQYVIAPDGRGDDALALGLRFITTL